MFIKNVFKAPCPFKAKKRYGAIRRHISEFASDFKRDILSQNRHQTAKTEKAL